MNACTKLLTTGHICRGDRPSTPPYGREGVFVRICDRSVRHVKRPIHRDHRTVSRDSSSDNSGLSQHPDLGGVRCGRRDLNLNPWNRVDMIAGFHHVDHAGLGHGWSAGPGPACSACASRGRLWMVVCPWCGWPATAVRCQVTKTACHKASQALARGQRAGRCSTGRRCGRASRAGTLIRWVRRVAPRATA